MAFLDKNDPIVLNVKITSRGRELISTGMLNFKYFAIGDGEMDYSFNKETEIKPFNHRILGAVHKNPEIISFIPKTYKQNIEDDDVFNEIGHISIIPRIFQNTAQPRGFFNQKNGDYSFIFEPQFFKQPHAKAPLSEMDYVQRRIRLYKTTDYVDGSPEPQVGDTILIRWTNDNNLNISGNTIEKNNPTPHLFYRIVTKSGTTLSSDNLIVEVDRELPNLTGNTEASVLVLTDLTNASDPFSGNFEQQYLSSFFENCCSNTINFPYWNLSIIFREKVLGTATTGKTFQQHKSANLGGFLSYIQNQEPTINKMGVIHYTNESKSNVYGEGFYLNTATLHIPTIMWHKSSKPELGLTLKSMGNFKTLGDIGLKYYDLADENENVVGKVFNELKLFIIEDQELLFALSYKSNRCWTLPNYIADVNEEIELYCE